ncbi:MAG: DHH family phosphoesterase [Candidatus Methanomethylophilaceae archaeon]
MGKFKEAADALREGKKAILVHNNADVDAMGSAYALCESFPDCTVCACGGTDYVANTFIENIGIEYSETYDPEDYDLTVVVDTSSPELLDAKVPEGSIVIDHHIPTGKWENVRFFCDCESISCCEVIAEIIREAGYPINRNVGLALLGGILTDSGHFQFAKEITLRNFAEIMEESGVAMDEAMSTISAEVRMSERVAVMKTIGRVKFERVADMIVASAIGNSFEASACRAIMNSGADVVFVGTQRDEKFRISSRATQEIVRRGINLGDILKTVGTDTDCDGGGHLGAAGLSGTGDVEALLGMCVTQVMDVFRNIRNEMQESESS